MKEDERKKKKLIFSSFRSLRTVSNGQQSLKSQQNDCREWSVERQRLIFHDGEVDRRFLRIEEEPTPPLPKKNQTLAEKIVYDGYDNESLN